MSAAVGAGPGGQRADAGAAQVLSYYADPPAAGASSQAGGETSGFEAKFQGTFREIASAEPFEALLGKPGDLAALFSPEQQAMLLGYMDTKIIPPGLFTDEPHNRSSGPQRILIASNMLAHGKIKFKGGLMDGEKWCACCCNGWAAGVIAYAGANPGAGYGASSSEQSISPTGEKSYGAGEQDTVEGSNVTSADVAEAMERGDFSAPQQAVVDAILAGSGDVERDVADLVALGQKLSLINVVHGDPTRPNGKLTQGMSGGTWKTPWPAWSKDPALRKQPG